jgi:hypothetical protein
MFWQESGAGLAGGGAGFSGGGVGLLAGQYVAGLQTATF